MIAWGFQTVYGSLMVPLGELLWHFQFVYGPLIVHLREMVPPGEVIHLIKPVRAHIIQSFVHRGVYYFSEPSQVRSIFKCGLEVNQSTPKFIFILL